MTSFHPSDRAEFCPIGGDPNHCTGVCIGSRNYSNGLFSLSKPYSLSLIQSCGSKKRAINEETESTGEVTLKTGRALHILPDGGMSVAPTIGGKVII